MDTSGNIPSLGLGSQVFLSSFSCFLYSAFQLGHSNHKVLSNATNYGNTRDEGTHIIPSNLLV